MNQIWIDLNVDLNLFIPNSVIEMPKEISEACQGNQQGLELVCDCIVLRDIRITFSCFPKESLKEPLSQKTNIFQTCVHCLKIASLLSLYEKLKYRCRCIYLVHVHCDPVV